MATILLISPQTLKNEYLFDENIEDKYVISNIQKCQDFIIKPLLGKTLYDELISQVENDTVTDENEILIDNYIQKIIVYFVMGEVVFSTAYKLKNQGMENGDPSRFGELVKISEKYKRDSETYQQILREYLCDNSISFIPEKETINTGIYLGKSCYKDYRNLPK